MPGEHAMKDATDSVVNAFGEEVLPVVREDKTRVRVARAHMKCATAAVLRGEWFVLFLGAVDRISVNEIVRKVHRRLGKAGHQARQEQGNDGSSCKTHHVSIIVDFRFPHVHYGSMSVELRTTHKRPDYHPAAEPRGRC
jgi:hypothetical protein